MLMEYSTMPRPFRGARSRSVIAALSGSVGSISPKAVPSSCSYCPTFPNDAPPRAGEVRMSMTMLVIFALAGCAAQNNAAAIAAGTDRRTILGPETLISNSPDLNCAGWMLRGRAAHLLRGSMDDQHTTACRAAATRCAEAIAIVDSATPGCMLRPWSGHGRCVRRSARSCCTVPRPRASSPSASRSAKRTWRSTSNIWRDRSACAESG